MTTTTKTNDTNDTMTTNKSPNNHATKKRKEEPNTQNRTFMDYEMIELELRNIFDDAAASSDQNASLHRSFDMTVNYNNSLNHKYLKDDLKDAFDSDDDDESQLDFTGNDTRFEQLLVTPALFFANIDLADVPICPFPFDTDLWPSDPEWDNELPYRREELDGKHCAYEDSLECHLRIGHDYISEDPNTVGTVKDWMLVIVQAFIRYDPDDEEDSEAMVELKTLQRMAIRLSVSDPVDLFPSASWKNGKLTMKSHGHAAWMACYSLFEAPLYRARYSATTAPPLTSKPKCTTADCTEGTIFTMTVESRSEKNPTEPGKTTLTKSSAVTHKKTPTTTNPEPNNPKATPNDTTQNTNPKTQSIVTDPTHWQGVQQAYHNSLNLDNTGKQWVKQLILQLFNISWDMWEDRNGITHSHYSDLSKKLHEIQTLGTLLTTAYAMISVGLSNR